MPTTEELLSRQAPHSPEAEQSVLGSMLIDSRCVSDVVGIVRPDDFYLQTNRDIYETIYEMFSYSQVIDPVTVLDKMRERGVFDEQNSAKYLMQLMEVTPSTKRRCCAICRKPLPGSSTRSTRARAARRIFWRRRRSASLRCAAAIRTNRWSTSAPSCSRSLTA